MALRRMFAVATALLLTVPLMVVGTGGSASAATKHYTIECRTTASGLFGSKTRICVSVKWHRTKKRKNIYVEKVRIYASNAKKYKSSPAIDHMYVILWHGKGEGPTYQIGSWDYGRIDKVDGKVDHTWVVNRSLGSRNIWVDSSFRPRFKHYPSPWPPLGRNFAVPSAA